MSFLANLLSRTNFCINCSLPGQIIRNNRLFNFLKRGNSYENMQKIFCFSTLVFTEHNNKNINPSTFAAIHAAKKFNRPISVIVIGNDSGDVCREISKIKNVNEVINMNNKLYDNLFSHIIADTLYNFLKKNNKYKTLIASTSSTTKDILPRLAAYMGVQPITDIIDIQSEDTFVRPTYAGNIFSKIKLKDAFQILTVRATAFSQENVLVDTSNVCEIINIEEEEENIKNNNLLSKVKFISQNNAQTDKPQLTNAKVVVSGGRALKNKEEFERILIPLSEKLNAAIGASRAAVDAGFVNNDLQVGQTGKVVAPILYFAIGISGAIQHLAGIQDSKIIVAINKDAEAPIFKVCDYGLVGDLFSIVPELTEKLQKQTFK